MKKCKSHKSLDERIASIKFRKRNWRETIKLAWLEFQMVMFSIIGMFVMISLFIGAMVIALYIPYIIFWLCGMIDTLPPLTEKW